MSIQIIILALMSAVATTYAICAWVLYNGGWFLPGIDRRPTTYLQRNSALCMVIGAIGIGLMILAEGIMATPTPRWILFIDWVSYVMLSFLPLGTVALRQEHYRMKHFWLVGLPLVVNLMLILIWGNTYPRILTYIGYGIFVWLLLLYGISMVMLRRWDSGLKYNYSDIGHKHTRWYRHLTMPFVLLVMVFWIPTIVFPWSNLLWVVYYVCLLFIILFYTSYCLTQEELTDTDDKLQPQNPIQDVSQPLPAWTDKLERKMREDFLYRQSDLTLTTLAQEVGVNRTYLSRYINQSGSTFYDYVNSFRIDEAKDLLTSTDLSIEQIALRCGFTSRTTFAHIFRDRVSLSATDYRKLCTNK